MSETPKDETFRHITCEKLTVKRPGRVSKIEVSVDTKGAYIDIYGRSNKPLIKLCMIDTNIGSQEGIVETYIASGFSLVPKGSI